MPRRKESAATVAVLVMRKSGNLLITLAAGIGTLLVFRNLS